MPITSNPLPVTAVRELTCASVRELTRASDRELTRCRICGFSEICTDEVVDRGLLALAECPRCEHRSTRSAASAVQRVAGLHGRRETNDEAANAA